VNQAFLVEIITTELDEARDAEEENITPDLVHNTSFESVNEDLTSESLVIETLKQDDERGRTLSMVTS